MGRDNQPKERQARKLARRKPCRPPFDRILVVCEGAKTGRLYFVPAGALRLDRASPSEVEQRGWPEPRPVI